jgi:hypothetical protein
MSSIPSRQRQRAEFLVVLLKSEEAKRVQKQLGIKDHGFLKRLSNNLTEYSSIADAPRTGRDRKYTDELLGQARDQLLEGESYLWSKQAFVDSLIGDGILAAGTSIHGFWEAFAPYMQQRGLRLVYGIQRLTFAMSSQHASLRLSWCRQQEEVITTRNVKEFWFTDEISLEHGPHPAGESHTSMQVTTSVFASLQPALQAISASYVGMLVARYQQFISMNSHNSRLHSSQTGRRVCHVLLKLHPPCRRQHAAPPAIPSPLNHPPSFPPMLCRKQVRSSSLAHPGQHPTPSPTLCA